VRDLTFWQRFPLGIQIYVRDLGTLLPVVLTIWLPANALVEFLLLRVLGDPGFMGEFFLGALVQGFLYPLEIASVLMILEGRDRGTPVRYGTALIRAGRMWFRVFLTEQITGVFILLKLLLLIIPGIIAALRYSLVDASTALEGAWPSEAMGRSSDLTQGRRRQIFWTFLFFYVVQSAFVFMLNIPLSLLGWDRCLAGAVFASCVDSLTFSVLGAFVYLFYVEGKRRIDEGADQGLPENSTSIPSST
jgi:hypothetical protein